VLRPEKPAEHTGACKLDTIAAPVHTDIKNLWEGRRNNRRARFYKLTPRGRKQISVEVSNWRRMVQAVNRVIDPLVP